MSTAAPLITIREVAAFERMMPFVRPFRFGAVTVTEAPQAFLRVEIDVGGYGRARGVAAEMMIPKWFDKSPAKTPGATVDDLRASVAHASAAYADHGPPDTAFGHHSANIARQTAWANDRELPALTANYGPALIDKAVLNALFKALGIGAADGLRRNAAGLDARLTPDLDDAEIADFIQSLQPSPSIAIRHTVGLLDNLNSADGLAAEIRQAQLRYFKIKIGGDVAADLERLAQVTACLTENAPGFRSTLDANEQYDPKRFADLLVGLASDPALKPLRDGLLYIEQPFDRWTTFDTPLAPADLAYPLIIDEADGDYGAFPRAGSIGYRGVSSKSCKGLYKSLLNAARARTWNRREGQPGRFFLAGEDLTCQAGLGVQQDTALAAMLGITHVERNGHHYVDGFGPAPAHEVEAFAATHPTLYVRHAGHLGLDIRAGTLPTVSLLSVPGFASGTEPDWVSLNGLRLETVFEETIA
jgi:hypothetical protein